MVSQDLLEALEGLKNATAQVCAAYVPDVPGDVTWGQVATLIEQGDAPPDGAPLQISRASIVTLMRHLDYISTLAQRDQREEVVSMTEVFARAAPTYGPRRREVE